MTDEHDPFDFPEWLMPEDPEVDPPMSDYLALAEWYWAHMVDEGSRDDARRYAAERREALIEHGLDLDDEATTLAIFYGWHHAQKSSMNFMPFDCPDQEHMLQHVIRNFQWNSVMLLLTLEPNTPNPPT